MSKVNLLHWFLSLRDGADIMVTFINSINRVKLWWHKTMTNGDNDDGGGLLEAIVVGSLGIIGGVVIAAALSALALKQQPACPVCKANIPRRSNPCPKCNALLKWG